MKPLINFLEDLQKEAGTAAMVNKVLELYEKTPTSYRSLTYDCLEGTYAAVSKYSNDSQQCVKSLSSVPTLTFLSQMSETEKNIFKDMDKEGFVVRGDKLNDFPITTSLGDFVKTVYNTANGTSSFQFSVKDIEFCKQISKQPEIALLYITGLLLDAAECYHHPVSTILYAIGMRLVYNHHYAVEFNWPIGANQNIYNDEEILLIDRGRSIWSLK